MQGLFLVSKVRKGQEILLSFFAQDQVHETQERLQEGEAMTIWGYVLVSVAGGVLSALLVLVANWIFTWLKRL